MTYSYSQPIPPNSVKNHWVSILVVTLLTFVVSVVVTLLQPMEYRSTFTMLLIEKDANLDGYAAAKSAERLSLSLGQIIPTASFADKVAGQLQDTPALKDNPLIFGDEQQRRELWRRQVETRVFPDVGQVKVSVYQTDRPQAEAIANALSVSLLALGGDYLGGGKEVVFKIVEYPLTTKHPVRPNIPVNLLAGLLLGLGASLAYHFLRSLAKPAVPVYPTMLAEPMPNFIHQPVASMAATPVTQPIGALHQPTSPLETPLDERRTFTAVGRVPVNLPAVDQAGSAPQEFRPTDDGDWVMP